MGRGLVSAPTLAALAALAATCGGCKGHNPPKVTRVWLGASDGCVRLATGELSCWGEHLGGARPTLPATTTAFGSDVREMALGGRYACALRESGTVTCRDDGPRAGPPIRGGKIGDVPGAAGAVAIGAGGAHACALMVDGVLRCWGANEAGQLGDGTTTAREEPAAVQVATGGAKIALFGLGDAHTCVALRGAKSVVRCFGRGVPSGDLLVGEDVAELTAGLEHTCARLRSGAVRCWGANRHGQLGDGTARPRSDEPAPALPGGVVEVRAGWRHTCARLANDTVMCWGANAHHQLADGTTTMRDRPLVLGGIYGVQELVAAGEGACARLSDASVRCWGANDTGQLADGTTREHDVPMPLRWR